MEKGSLNVILTRCLLLTGAVLLALLLMGGNGALPSHAQLPLPPLTSPDSNRQPLPPGVERQGTIETAAITLEEQTLFRIASPTVFDRSNLGQQIPVEVRAKQIESNLQRLIPASRSESAPFDPASFAVRVETVNGFPVLYAEDAQASTPRPLLTVTDTDAQYHGISKAQLAEDWRDIIETDLRQAIERRQPEALRQQILTVVRVLGASLVATLLLGVCSLGLEQRKRYLHKRQRAKAQTQPQEARPGFSSVNNEANRPHRLLRNVKLNLGLQRRLQIVRFFQWLLFWCILFIWAFSLAYSLYTFPETRLFARKLVVTPILLLITFFVIGLLNQLIDISVEKVIQQLSKERELSAGELQRITTIARVVEGMKRVLVYTIGVLWVLQWLGFLSVSVLALGTVVALVISFAAQNLLRDLVNGLLILMEDQYRIGDLVIIDDKSGIIENLNLRITQLRSPAGHLITLPNSSIVRVENLSRFWSRSDFRIEVAYDTDVDLALKLVRDTADEMAEDPDWQDWILDTHELFGVDQLSHTGILIRIWIKTAPLKQWPVAMELRRRLKKTFDRQGIKIGIPQQIWMPNQAENSSNVDLLPGNDMAPDSGDNSQKPWPKTSTKHTP
ncbi:MAG: mechanosensitive ion channel family protein [Leptolyngbyaceae cyanobacterium SM2_5_2]|nr:mechanosensitive ion channel family protein [Leptolyngbyaceae cyanobacterium SM2_5_2]